MGCIYRRQLLEFCPKFDRSEVFPRIYDPPKIIFLRFFFLSVSNFFFSAVDLLLVERQPISGLGDVFLFIRRNELHATMILQRFRQDPFSIV